MDVQDLNTVKGGSKKKKGDQMEEVREANRQEYAEDSDADTEEQKKETG
jgi:hypothetical protein